MKTIFILQHVALIILVVTFSCKGQNKGENISVRQPVVAGSFYPASKEELASQLNLFFNAPGIAQPRGNVAAIISPHAGYVFSGEVAASAYGALDPGKKYGRVFVLGTSHHVYLNGASVNPVDAYATPLGNVPVDTAVAHLLIRENKFFEYSPGAHSKEHSIEVQLPFLQFHLKNGFKIVPIIIGTQSPATCKKIAEALKPYFTEENLFVVSSDFSHYPPYASAAGTDKTTGDAILANSTEAFMKALQKNESMNITNLATSCCGWSSILTLLYLTSEAQGIKVAHLQYKNSGDSAYGDKERVVGYHSFAFTREEQPEKTATFSLSAEEKKLLLKLARSTIESWIRTNSFPPANFSPYSENLKKQCGAFVTLTKDGRLRGCIGRFMATEPLYSVVQQMAVAAASQDSRFQPVQMRELKEIEIEISVLTPLKKIENISEFELGKHGIYMRKGNQSGTFLPQVARETGWTTGEFLGHCARDKAGIGWDGWKDAELYTYKAYVFNEKELGLIPSEK